MPSASNKHHSTRWPTRQLAMALAAAEMMIFFTGYAPCLREIHVALRDEITSREAPRIVFSNSEDATCRLEASSPGVLDRRASYRLIHREYSSEYASGMTTDQAPPSTAHLDTAALRR